MQLKTILIVPTVFLMTACQSTEHQKQGEVLADELNLNLEDVKQDFNAENIIVSVKNETSSCGEGKHLTVTIVGSKSSEKESFNMNHAVSRTALSVYEQFYDMDDHGIVALRISPKSGNKLEMYESSVYPLEKLEIQRNCKNCINQFITARISGNSNYVSSVDETIISKNDLDTTLSLLQQKLGKLVSYSYQGAGSNKTLENGIEVKLLYVEEIYENETIKVGYIVTYANDFKIVGFQVLE